MAYPTRCWDNDNVVDEATIPPDDDDDDDGTNAKTMPRLHFQSRINYTTDDKKSKLNNNHVITIDPTTLTTATTTPTCHEALAE